MVEAASRPTLGELRSRRKEIVDVAARYGARNVRVFGSVARGEAHMASDVDLLVDITGGASGFAYFGLLDTLQRELSKIIGYQVDVVDSAGLRRLRDRVLREAVPL